MTVPGEPPRSMLMREAISAKGAPAAVGNYSQAVKVGNMLYLSGQICLNAATGQFATVPGVITVPAAAFTQNAATGAYAVTPGTVTLTVSGTV